MLSHLPLFHQGLMLTLGLVALTPNVSLAATPNTSSSRLSSNPNNIELSQSRSPMSDGIYLYGQSATPEKIGHDYLVFRVQQGEVIGAIYQPRSEFSCFSGSLTPQHLNISISDPYDPNIRYPYPIVLEALSPIANSQLRSSMGLEGFHQIEAVSDNDQRILNVCLSDQS